MGARIVAEIDPSKKTKLVCEQSEVSRGLFHLEVVDENGAVVVDKSGGGGFYVRGHIFDCDEWGARYASHGASNGVYPSLTLEFELGGHSFKATGIKGGDFLFNGEQPAVYDKSLENTRYPKRSGFKPTVIDHVTPLVQDREIRRLLPEDYN